MKVTHQLNCAVGVIRNTTEDWSLALCRYSHCCRRYAIKFGWSKSYEESALRWGISQAAREVLRCKARHEPIVHPFRFVLSKMRKSLLRDDNGALFIPRYRIEHGHDTQVTYADVACELRGGGVHELR